MSSTTFRASTRTFSYCVWQDADVPAEGVLMSDWQAELDALIRQTFVLNRSSLIEPPRTPPREVTDPVVLTPAAKFVGSEREEIAKRVASFRAHQQRAIREREEYAASVLGRMYTNLS
jgi:hypothetical protein